MNYSNILVSLKNEAKYIFHLVQKKGPLTKCDLGLLSNFTLSTLNRFIQPLEENKLIVEVGIGESSGGRKPLLYDVNTNQYYVLGIDISRTYAQIIITNLKMQIICKERFVMDKSFSPTKTVEKIGELFNKMLAANNLQASTFVGAGLGTVGPIDKELGMICNPIKFDSPDWMNVPIQQMLETELSMPVYIDNGANTAILAEHLFGQGKGFSNMAYFNCGIGIRTGAISKGRIIGSINNDEDAFAHMVIDVDGEPCLCGNFGCIECYCSADAITKKFISSIKRGRSSILSDSINDLDFTKICHAAENNDDLSKEIIIESATTLGVGLANFINLINPSLIILSGPLIKSSSLFYKVSTEVATKKQFLKGHKDIVFLRGGEFDENAISIGAASLVVETLINSPIF